MPLLEDEHLTQLEYVLEKKNLEWLTDSQPFLCQQVLVVQGSSNSNQGTCPKFTFLRNGKIVPSCFDKACLFSTEIQYTFLEESSSAVAVSSVLYTTYSQQGKVKSSLSPIYPHMCMHSHRWTHQLGRKKDKFKDVSTWENQNPNQRRNETFGVF